MAYRPLTWLRAVVRQISRWFTKNLIFAPISDDGIGAEQITAPHQFHILFVLPL